MKILLLSHNFHPQVGGLETVARLLGEAFTARGHEVRLVTQTPAPSPEQRTADQSASPFQVYRRPNSRQLLRLTRWCDIFFQNNVSLQTLWPLLFVRRPWIVAHQTWLTRLDGRLGWQDRLKLWLLPLSVIGASSQAIVKPLRTSVQVVGNPFESDLFGLRPEVPRDQQLVFVGRLVSEKGADLLLEALHILKREHQLAPRLTVVGVGPERPHLEHLAQQLGITPQITFVGQKTGEELVCLLNRHHILVVPSRFEEPFGLVALEGIACGCVVVGSARGGLGEAVGPCGLLFPNKDVAALTDVLVELLMDDELCQRLRTHAPGHLAKFHSSHIADLYLQIFERALHKS